MRSFGRFFCLELNMNILVVSVLCVISVTAIADPLLGLPVMPIPADNRQNPEKIALGKKLFHDPRFSTTRSVSCASCHQSSKAFTDGLEKAMGIKGAIGVRNTPTLLNVGFIRKASPKADFKSDRTWL